MDRLRKMLEMIQVRKLAEGKLRALLHVLIGRRVALADGTEISVGQTWREAAALLKRVRWDRAAVLELGIDPNALPPRDRERFWYMAIARATVNSPEASAAADLLIEPLRALGYEIGPPPGPRPSPDSPAP
jgi:hypothetical protein